MIERLAREAYTEQNNYGRERVELFRDAWVFVGVEADFPKSGDSAPVMAGAFPLFVVRDKEGSLAAFHNMCRHRGAELVEEPGNLGGSVVCPYHRWSYGLDGAFRGAPDLETCFPGLDRSAHALKPASMGVFKGLLFANPNPKADFDEWIGGLSGAEWPHVLTDKELREGAPLVYDMKCDWKVFVENALDGYHLAYLHEQTLGGPNPTENVWERKGDNMIWYATDGKDGRHRLPGLVRRNTKRVPTVKRAAEPGYGGVYFLFPTTLIVPTPFGISISTLRPVAPGRCELHSRQWVGRGQPLDERKHIPGYDPKTNRISSHNWSAHPLESGDFQTEDVWICEKVQRGLESPAYEHGPLSIGAGAEDPIRWFHQSYLERMSTG